MQTENYQNSQGSLNQQSSKKNLNHNAEQVASHLKEAAQTLNSDLQHLGQTTKKVAQEAMQQVRQNVGQYYQVGLEKTREVEKNMESQIRSHPLSALAIAAGIGLVVGAIWKSGR